MLCVSVWDSAAKPTQAGAFIPTNFLLSTRYEREGEDLEYEFVEEGTGKKKTFFCRITLPVDAEEPVIAEGEGTNKKQAKILAALEACKTLDIRGLLFQVGRSWVNDYNGEVGGGNVNVCFTFVSVK